MEILITVIIGYLFGCIQTSYFIGKIKKLDIREHGSKNAGTTNAAIVLGLKYGLLTFLCDVGKTILSMLIIRVLFPGSLTLEYIAGVACIIGHIFPFYMKFNGGKGFACYIGMIFTINHIVGLLFILAIILITILSDYLVLATISVTTIYPMYLAYNKANPIIIAILSLVFVIIFYKHIINLKRIKNGEETGLREFIADKVSAKSS